MEISDGITFHTRKWNFVPRLTLHTYSNVSINFSFVHIISIEGNVLQKWEIMYRFEIVTRFCWKIKQKIIIIRYREADLAQFHPRWNTKVVVSRHDIISRTGKDYNRITMDQTTLYNTNINRLLYTKIHPRTVITPLCLSFSSFIKKLAYIS